MEQYQLNSSQSTQADPAFYGQWRSVLISVSHDRGVQRSNTSKNRPSLLVLILQVPFEDRGYMLGTKNYATHTPHLTGI